MDVPLFEELSYIITEIAVVRYNRIGSEGLSSHSVEGESQSWSDTDFAPYQEEIDAYKAAQQTPATQNVFTFFFLGLDVITAVIIVFLLGQLDVEQVIDKEQAEIAERHAAAGDSAKKD